MGLLVLCIATVACNKHKTTAHEENMAAQHAAMGAEAEAQQARAEGAEAAEHAQIPPHEVQRETASAHGMSAYGEGSRPAGTLPGQGTQPGTTRSVEPSQGTIRPPASTATQEAAATQMATGPAGTGQTAGDLEQGTSASDRGMTQRIRRALLEDESISFTAKNVQIITRDGNVTLRGLVLSESERKAVEQTARNYVGAGKVVDLLQLKSSTPLTQPVK